MERVLWLVFFVLLSPVVFGQRIVEYRVEEDSKVIHTSWEKIHDGISEGGLNELSIMFRYENEKVYLHVKWLNNKKVYVDKDSSLMFMMNNGQEVSVRAVDDFETMDTFLSSDNPENGIDFIESIYSGDFDFFETDVLASNIRIYAHKSFADMYITKDNSLKINASYQLLQTHLNPDEF